MDLLSDLDEKMWHNFEGTIPKEDRKNAGYGYFSICRSTPKTDNSFNVFLTSNAGDPVQALLCGVHRNPLKNVGHCYMKLLEKREGMIITAVVVEDDWVVMNDDVLASEFNDKTEEDRQKEMKKLEAKITSIDIGIFSDLQHEFWEKKGIPPRLKSNLGYVYQDIIRVQKDPDTTDAYRFLLCSSTGVQSTAVMTNVNRNAFSSITKGYVKVVDGIIKGLMVDEQWVEMKN